MTAHIGARAAALRRRLSERDIAVLASLNRVRLLTSQQVQRLHIYESSPASRPRRTRSILKRLHDLQLVVRLSRTIGGIRAGSSGHVYGLSGLGQAVLDVQGLYEKRRRRIWETKPHFQDHVLAVAEIFVRLVESTRSSSAELLAFDAEPACWRSYTGSGGEPVTVKPDAFVRTGIGDIERSAFLEVDLATEGPGTINRKCQAFVAYWRNGLEQQRHGLFPSVLWLVPSEQRRERLQLTIRQLARDAHQLFAVAVFADAVSILTEPEGGA